MDFVPIPDEYDEQRYMELIDHYQQYPYPSWGSQGEIFPITELSNYHLINAYKFFNDGQYLRKKLENPQQDEEVYEYHRDYMMMCLSGLAKERGFIVDPKEYSYWLGWIRNLETEVENKDSFDNAIQLDLERYDIVVYYYQEGWDIGQRMKDVHKDIFKVEPCRIGYLDCLRCLATDRIESFNDQDYLSGYLKAVNSLIIDYMINLSEVVNHPAHEARKVQLP